VVTYRQEEMAQPRPSSIIKLGAGGEVKVIRE
jgi:L-threonylcarbamoyladenylate synthase